LLTTPSFRPLADPSKIWGLTVNDVQVLRDNPRRVAPDILRLFVSARIVITTWGPVGARKTRTIEAFERETDENGVPYQVITVQPSHEDPTVIHGMRYTSPDPESGKVIMLKSVPDIAQAIVDYYENTGGLTILFLDEMTTCMPAQQHAMLGLLTHGKYGDVDIGPYMTPIMAANPEGTVSSVYDLGEQVINRGGHIAWYGDPTLFLEEWRTGFGNDELKPDPEVDWFISTLLHQNMEGAFRSEKWDVDELVPWDLFEHSERTTTDLGKMIGVVNEIFADSPAAIRHYYMIEVTRALQGPEWASKAAVVCQLEGEKIDGRKVIKTVRDSQIKPDWTLEQLTDAVGDSFYTQDTRQGSSVLAQDQVDAIASDLLSRAKTKTGVDPEASLALWAFAMTAPDEATTASMHSYLLQLLLMGFDEANKGNLTDEQVRPAFVSEEVREALKYAIRRSRPAS